MNSLDQPFILLPGQHTRRCDRLKEIPAGSSLTPSALQVPGRQKDEQHRIGHHRLVSGFRRLTMG